MTLPGSHQVRRRVSRECLDFLNCLICNADRRLGRNGVDEIKAHPWFQKYVITSSMLTSV